MNNAKQETWGWELATNADALVKTLGGYTSFHDSAVRCLTMRRGRETRLDTRGKELSNGRTRELVDLRLEVLHNRYGAPPAPGQHDRIVVVDCLDVRSSEIDLNAMLEEATIAEMTLTRSPDGLLKLDLMPSVGLDVRVTCAQIVICDLFPYVRPR